MSVRVMAKAWEADLPSTDKLVLLALADWSNDVGACWPSIRQLREKCGLSERAVQLVIKRLEKAGHLKRDVKVGKGVNYTVTPRTTCTPADDAPPHEMPETPAPRAPNTSRTTKLPKKDKPSLVAHELPDDWTPNQFGAGTQSRKIVDGWPPGELDCQLEQFRAHHRKRGDKFKSWQDAWSTWVLNSRKFGNRYVQPPANDELQNPMGRALLSRERERAAGFAGF